MVEERHRLLPRRRDLPRRRRRRLRGHGRAHRAHRPRRAPGRHVPVADALLPHAQPRRRLRRRRLPRGRSAAGRPRRRARRHPPRPRPRPARDRRPRGQPHLRPAPVVPRGARRIARRGFATTTCGATTPSPRRGRRPTVDVGRGGRAVLQPQLRALPARPEHRQSRGPRRDREDRRLLAGPRRLRLPHGRRALPGRGGQPARHRSRRRQALAARPARVRDAPVAATRC